MDIESEIAVIVFITFISSLVFLAVAVLGPLIRRLQPPSQRMIAERMMIEEIGRLRIANIELGRVISEYDGMSRKLLRQLEEMGVEPAARPNGIIKAAKRGEMPLQELHQLIEQYFNSEEIHSLAFKLGIEYENITGSTRKLRALSLIEYCARHGLLQALVGWCKKKRPSVDWPHIP